MVTLTKSSAEKTESRAENGLGILERAFSNQGLPGPVNYGQPYVDLDYLATDYPEQLTSKLYTSGHAQMNNLQPSGKTFRFPTELTIQELAKNLQGILRAASVPHALEPVSIDDKTGLVLIRYQPKEGINSAYFRDTFLPLMAVAVTTFINRYRGVALTT